MRRSYRYDGFKDAGEFIALFGEILVVERLENSYRDVKEISNDDNGCLKMHAGVELSGKQVFLIAG